MNTSALCCEHFILINDIPVRILEDDDCWRVPQIEIGAICGKSYTRSTCFINNKKILIKSGYRSVNIGMVEVHEAIEWVNRQGYKASGILAVNSNLRHKKYSYDISVNAQLKQVYLENLPRPLKKVREFSEPSNIKEIICVVREANSTKMDESNLPEAPKEPVTKINPPNSITNELIIEYSLVKDYLVDTRYRGLNMWSLSINNCIHVCYSDVRHRFKGSVILTNPKYVKICDSLCIFIPYTEFVNLVETVGIISPM